MEVDLPTLSREELYERVWTDAVRTVAGEMGVSDVWLKKCCAQADIPVPDRGYWAKLRAGKPVIRMKLAPRGPGKPYRITIGSEPRQFYWPVDPERELAQPPPIEPNFPEPIESVEARIRKAVGKVIQQRDLKSPHLHIRKLLEDDEKRRVKTPGSYSRFYWSDPLFDSPFERRRLRILNTLFFALTKAGHKPRIHGDEARSLGVKVGMIDVGFKLDHPGAKEDRDGIIKPRLGKVDTLKLVIGNGGLTWVDGEDQKLEDHLTEIVVHLILAGEQRLRSEAVNAFERACERRKEMETLLAKQRAEAIERERQRRIQAEEERRQGLLTMAADHRAANDIRALVSSVTMTESADLTRSQNLAIWAEWALAVADRTDPVNRIQFDPEGHASIEAPILPESD